MVVHVLYTQETVCTTELNNNSLTKFNNPAVSSSCPFVTKGASVHFEAVGSNAVQCLSVSVVEGVLVTQCSFWYTRFLKV